MTYILALLVIVLYVLGAFLMRALLKIGETSDQDEWKPILLWPYYIAAPVFELLREKKFKW